MTTNPTDADRLAEALRDADRAPVNEVHAIVRKALAAYDQSKAQAATGAEEGGEYIPAGTHFVDDLDGGRLVRSAAPTIPGEQDVGFAEALQEASTPVRHLDGWDDQTDDVDGLVGRAEKIEKRVNRVREWLDEIDTVTAANFVVDLSEAIDFLTDLCALARRQAAEIERLKEWRNPILGKCKASDGWDALDWAGDKDGWGFVHYFIGHLETRALTAETALSEPRKELEARTKERDEEMTDTLGDALPREMARVRDRLLPLYDAIPTGIFAAAIMRQTLDRATRALAEGDVIEMLRVYEELKEFKE